MVFGDTNSKYHNYPNIHIFKPVGGDPIGLGPLGGCPQSWCPPEDAQQRISIFTYTCIFICCIPDK